MLSDNYIDLARAATRLACAEIGVYSDLQRVTIGYFALLRARAGNISLVVLAVEALAQALADPGILRRLDG